MKLANNGISSKIEPVHVIIGIMTLLRYIKQYTEYI